MVQTTDTPTAAPAGKRLVTVNISGMMVSDDRGVTLVTYSLGSCVGLSLHDPVAGIGGMIHCMLPLSRIDPAKADAKPHMFVDTGVTDLLQTMYEMGAQKRRLVAHVAGAGSPLGKEHVFKIGQRNYTVLRKVLWKNEILIRSQDVGGSMARTLFLELATGRCWIKADGKEVDL